MPASLEDVYRRDWPLIVGAVARYTSDLTLAEDCVQEAVIRALALDGELRNPAAWITTTARRIAVDALRRRQTQARLLPQLAREPMERDAAEMTEPFAGDERLLLITLISTPELSEQDRVAMALRFVCGQSTADIARVLLVPETTLAARLTRAKKRISASGLPPADSNDLVPHIDTILTTLYLLYTVGHGASPGPGNVPQTVRATAISLCRDLVRLHPEHLESKGLLALLLLTEARQAGFPSSDDDGARPSLEEADRSLWDQALITEGMLLAAAALPGGGRFSLQAGISGIHDAAPTWEATDWPAITRLYERLYAVWPAPVVVLNRIIARGLSPDVGPEAALDDLDSSWPTPSGPLAGQVWAARADLLRRIGRSAEAAESYREALASDLADDDKQFLRRRLASLE
ncbi:RNA polymerase sigma factor [Arthrobacter sp. 35W]|uniref:RNA polymerase sigma factor n=1 Tax=Arthrobacter sp. 35W TaxID=1132441 RepID=UPI0018CA66AB|nr:sigma-70 family RNA polymerase sigma factor [Arthrobacter sp. 35W]